MKTKKLKAEGKDGYWQYCVLSLYDDNNGSVSAAQTASVCLSADARDRKNDLTMRRSSYQRTCAPTNIVGLSHLAKNEKKRINKGLFFLYDSEEEPLITPMKKIGC